MPSKKDTRVIYHSFVVLVVHSMSYHIVIYYECVYSSFITFFPYGIIYDIMMFLSLFGVAVDNIFLQLRNVTARSRWATHPHHVVAKNGKMWEMYRKFSIKRWDFADSKWKFTMILIARKSQNMMMNDMNGWFSGKFTGSRMVCLVKYGGVLFPTTSSDPMNIVCSVNQCEVKL